MPRHQGALLCKESRVFGRKGTLLNANGGSHFRPTEEKAHSVKRWKDRGREGGVGEGEVFLSWIMGNSLRGGQSRGCCTHPL